MDMAITEILAICAAIITLSGALTAITGWIAKAKAPNKLQDERIKKLEDRMDKAEDRLERGSDKFHKQDDSTKIMMECMLALMKHAINGNDVKMLEDMQTKLEKHLIDRKE